jgi:uncharacterized membrane protein
LAKFGVNVKDIVENNRGDLKKTVMDFGAALDTLNPLDRARAIETMFGKFQFARISTLLQNINKEGSQAAKALQLANMSSIQLAAMSRKELDKLESSPMYKFQKSIADLQLKIAPIGETFLKAVTPVIESVSKFLDGFNKMGDGFKQFVVVGTAIPYFLVLTGLRGLSAAKTSAIGMSEPVFGGIFAWIFLYEKLNFTQSVGAIVVLVGIYLANRARLSVKDAT